MTYVNTFPYHQYFHTTTVVPSAGPIRVVVNDDEDPYFKSNPTGFTGWNSESEIINDDKAKRWMRLQRGR